MSSGFGIAMGGDNASDDTATRAAVVSVATKVGGGDKVFCNVAAWAKSSAGGVADSCLTI